MTVANKWIDICSVDDLQADSGICALIENKQVAIFYMPKDEAVYAISNYDPFSSANVISRGLIGDIKGAPMVSSPLHKQHYDLSTGQCIEDETVKLDIYTIRIEQQRVEVRI